MDKNELMALQESIYVELKEGKDKVPLSLYETYIVSTIYRNGFSI